MSDKSTGFSLIEVLITLFIIASGLLGLGLAQISALNANQEAYFRSQATTLASSLSNRLKTNENYFTDPDIKSNIYTADQASQYTQYCRREGTKIVVNTKGEMPDCAKTICSNEQMARYDVEDICINEFAAVSLPSGEIGVICYDADQSDADTCSPGSVLSILVGWQSKASRDDLGESAMHVDPLCSSIMWQNLDDEAKMGRQCIKVDTAL